MRWVGSKQAAAHIGICSRTLEKLVRYRLIPYAQPGGPGSMLKFNLEAIDAWLMCYPAPRKSDARRQRQNDIDAKSATSFI
jgi:hypothetical protein